LILPLLSLLMLAAVVLPAPAAMAAPELGASLFEAHCAGCHLHGGNVIRRGKTLKLAALQRRGLDSAEAIAAIAAEGIGQMGAYGDVLGPGGAEAVAAWVWQQALDGWS
jgi:cytochrome c6